MQINSGLSAARFVAGWTRANAKHNLSSMKDRSIQIWVLSTLKLCIVDFSSCKPSHTIQAMRLGSSLPQWCPGESQPVARCADGVGEALPAHSMHKIWHRYGMIWLHDPSPSHCGRQSVEIVASLLAQSLSKSPAKSTHSAHTCIVCSHCCVCMPGRH